MDGNGCGYWIDGKFLKSEITGNCDLIAAAPDLLAACHAAIILLRGSGFTESSATLVQLKQAVAKAEGER
jgi:hypothetical protein